MPESRELSDEQATREGQSGHPPKGAGSLGRETFDLINDLIKKGEHLRTQIAVSALSPPHAPPGLGVGLGAVGDGDVGTALQSLARTRDNSDLRTVDLLLGDANIHPSVSLSYCIQIFHISIRVYILLLNMFPEGKNDTQDFQEKDIPQPFLNARKSREGSGRYCYRGPRRRY